MILACFIAFLPSIAVLLAGWKYSLEMKFNILSNPNKAKIFFLSAFFKTLVSYILELYLKAASGFLSTSVIISDIL
jgi:hypothetical protein